LFIRRLGARLARAERFGVRARQRQDAGDIADGVDELRAGWHHDPAVVLQRSLDVRPASRLLELIDKGTSF
jgi:hypothetical protein